MTPKDHLLNDVCGRDVRGVLCADLRGTTHGSPARRCVATRIRGVLGFRWWVFGIHVVMAVVTLNTM